MKQPIKCFGHSKCSVNVHHCHHLHPPGYRGGVAGGGGLKELGEGKGPIFSLNHRAGDTSSQSYLLSLKTSTDLTIRLRSTCLRPMIFYTQQYFNIFLSFAVVRTPNTIIWFTLCTSLSARYITVHYWYNVIQQISRPYSSYLTETFLLNYIGHTTLCKFTVCSPETLCLLMSNSSFPPCPQPLATTDSMNLIILVTSYKRNHLLPVFLSLVYFTGQNDPKVFPPSCILQNFLLSSIHCMYIQ